jgi:hypothetical protein
MKSLKYILAFSAACAISATTLFAQRSSSAVQTVTFSVKRSHSLAELAVQQQVAENSRFVAGRTNALSPARMTEGDRIVAQDVKVSMSESIHRSTGIDVVLAPLASPEAPGNASSSRAHKIVQSQTTDFDSSPFQTRTTFPSSDQVVLTITK